ncbi:negative regulation of viral entry into host cell [Marasmius tenuissimus]|uniref:Negative regulation of viral entry into host cell n=1 Tax=Marasmius tenuissimus TaxID=585030 RepID=A0ABR2Z812_9AGAR
MVAVSHQARARVRALMLLIEIDWTVPWLSMHETERAVVVDIVTQGTKGLSIQREELPGVVEEEAVHVQNYYLSSSSMTVKLTCELCGNITGHPSLLVDCGHSFCSGCLAVHLEAQNDAEDPFTCPLKPCDAFITINPVPNHGVQLAAEALSPADVRAMTNSQLLDKFPWIELAEF